MSEILDLSSHIRRLESPVGHIFLRAITMTAEKLTGNPSIQGVKQWKDMDSSKVTIDFKINGVDCPFFEIVESLFKSYQEDVKETALSAIDEKVQTKVELIRSKCDSIECTLSEFILQLRGEIRKTYPDARFEE